jgi:outer membrane protein TolC
VLVRSEKNPSVEPKAMKALVNIAAIVALAASALGEGSNGSESTAEAHPADRDKAWTLADCQREALRQSRDLKAAHARLEAARAAARQVGRWSNPDFNVRALSDEREFYLAQEFDLWGKRPAANRFAEAEAEVVSTRRGLLERELLEVVARHYWNLARWQRLVALRAEELEAWKRFMTIRQQEVDLGAFAYADVLLLRETVAEREQSLRQARFEADSSRAALNSLLARPPHEPLVVKEALPDAVQHSAQEVLSAALHTDPAAKEAWAKLIAAGHRLEGEQRQWRPNPRLGPAVKEENGRWAAGVQLSFSIPVWDRNRDGIQAAAAGKEQAVAEIESAELLAVQNAYRAYLSHAAVSEMLAQYETMVLPSARERLLQARQAFEAGDLSERELLAVKLEWMRRQQEAETLRYGQAEAGGMINLMMRSSVPDHATMNR